MMTGYLRSLPRIVQISLFLIVAFASIQRVSFADNPDETQAIKEIKRRGGRVKGDDNLPGRPVKAVYFPADTRFGSQDVQLLKPLKNLRILLLRGKVADADLKGIRELKHLKDLNLSQCQITDAAMKEVSDLEELTILGLYGTRITDEGLKEVAKIKSLTSIELSGTKITDAGLGELRRLNNLTNLSLMSTQITDNGVPALKHLKHLETLYLNETKITEGALSDLKRALPNVEITP